MQTFYLSGITEPPKTVVFPPDESRHLAKVLRKKTGDKVLLTNGHGLLMTVELTEINTKSCKALVTDHTTEPKDSFSIHIAIAPTKSIERFEWFLEKATEIGIHRISPIICEHSERKVLKTDRLHKILVAAMKQSQRTYLPVLEAPSSFDDFIKAARADQKLIAHCDNSSKQDLKKVIQKGAQVCLLIGPEGDFSPAEIEKAHAAGFQPVSLGEKRLRTETAALMGCHTVVLMND